MSLPVFTHEFALRHPTVSLIFVSEPEPKAPVEGILNTNVSVDVHMVRLPNCSAIAVIGFSLSMTITLLSKTDA